MEELLNICSQWNQALAQNPQVSNWYQHIRKNPVWQQLAQKMEQALAVCKTVHQPSPASNTHYEAGSVLKAVAWNIERGKRLHELQEVLATYPELQNADFYFLTEVDWGMARSENKNIAAELGKALGHYAYFAPSYYNLTKGHGVERHQSGENQWGLHGKAILSRYPLNNLRSIPLPNLTHKLRSKESRLGQKRALLGDISIGDKSLTLACTHLDAFSSPRGRARQLKPALLACQNLPHILMAGDWNTNTLDSTHTLRLIPSILYQFAAFRPVNMIKYHHPYPERHFERPLFKLLQAQGFDTASCNEAGRGTYDLLTNDHELGEMANDQFPRWALKAINRLIEKSGGHLSLKLDWFAQKNLHCLEKKVVPLKTLRGQYRASDHHPILLHFLL